MNLTLIKCWLIHGADNSLSNMVFVMLEWSIDYCNPDSEASLVVTGKSFHRPALSKPLAENAPMTTYS